MPSFDEYGGFPQRPRRYREHPAPWMVLVPTVAFLLLAGLAIGYFLFRDDKRTPQNPEAKLREVTPRGDRDDIEKNRISVFKDVNPGVVNVDTLRIQRMGYVGTQERQQGTGSGFVWDDQGRIVTNFHVVQDALAITRAGDVSIQTNATIRVTLADRTAWNARLVGIAPDNDLAVLQIDAPAAKLKPLKVGSSSDLDVGQTVFAIGNPFGQSLTFTEGIISALEREIQSVTDRPISGVIQTDASLNPGNSGGPLLDREGRLIGVNTAITSPTGGSVGIGYAIPVDTVNRVVTALIKSGRDARPTMGFVALREQDTRALGYDKGVMIGEVRARGPAEKAGLRGFRGQEHGDLILAIDGEPINTLKDLERVMAKCKVQQTIKLTIQRERRTQELSLTLEGI
jgi:S1-C subfamily serine protease